MQDGEKIVVDKLFVDKLRGLNNRMSVLFAKIGQTELNIMALQKEKQLMSDEVDKLNEQVKSITDFISDQYKIKDGKWTVDWETGEVLTVK